jgi:hypothetical protein
LQRLAAEVRVGVEGREQRDRDSRIARCGEVAQQQLGGIGVGPALAIVVHVVKFGDRGIPVPEHLDVQMQRDRLRLARREPGDELVHQLAPGPEIVVRRCADLGKTRPLRAEKRANAGSPSPAVPGLRALCAFGARVCRHARVMSPRGSTSMRTLRAQPCGSNASAANQAPMSLS